MFIWTANILDKEKFGRFLWKFPCEASYKYRRFWKISEKYAGERKLSLQILSETLIEDPEYFDKFLLMSLLDIILKVDGSWNGQKGDFPTNNWSLYN